jgi:DNA polymerase-3 subunit delta'
MTAQRERYRALVGQRAVRDLLERAVSSGHVAHAYLFVGPPGSGKTETAFEFAASILCPHGGCGACDDCIRVSHRTHPDVRYVRPGGAGGYVIDQMREIVHDAQLSPMRASRRVYILDRADLLNASAANAFLKTLEEPPEDVVFILLARVQERVLDTIRSRCQVVTFHQIPVSDACSYLQQEVGASLDQARMALAAGAGSLAQARQFLVSPSRKQLRATVLRVLARVPVMDDLDVLLAARELVDAAKAPLDEVRMRQERELEEGKDFIDKRALRSIEKRQRRELTAGERQGLLDVFTVTRSWLRDCQLVSMGCAQDVVNVDVREQVHEAASRTSVERIPAAVEATRTAETQISYNVSPQLAVETMLFMTRKAFQ